MPTKNINEISTKEGWIISYSEGTHRGNGYHIEKYEEAGIFETDRDAVEHVFGLAAQGSQFHREAIKLLSNK